jgi:hypothetical protein
MSNFVQHVATQPDVLAATNEPLDNLVINLPNASLAGNSLIVVVAYPNGATPAITDNKSNTWPASGAAGTVTADAGAGNMALQAFVLSNSTTGTQTVTINFGGNPQIPVRAWVTEVPYTVGATIEGHATATAVNASGVVSPGAFTPSVANCLVLSYMSDSNTSGTTNPTLIAAASGYALNDADISWNPGTGTPSASQWLLQGTAASTTASFTLTSGGTETYNVLAFALTTATPGTQIPAGIHIDRLLYFSTNSVPASWKLQIPSTGNLGFLCSPVDTGAGTGTVSAIDSDSVTWTNKGNIGGPIFVERDNQTPSATRTITLDFTGHTGANQMYRYYDISGAATAPFDKTAFASGGANNANSVANAPSITPATANGLVIGCFNNGLGPTPGLTSPTGVIYDEPFYDIAKFVAGISTTTLTVASTTWGGVTSGGNLIRGTGVTVGTTIQTGAGPTYVIQPSQTVSSGTTMFEESTDGSQVNWGNGLAHLYNSGTSALNFTWTIANQPSVSYAAGAIAFKAAPTTITSASVAWWV